MLSVNDQPRWIRARLALLTDEVELDPRLKKRLNDAIARKFMKDFRAQHINCSPRPLGLLTRGLGYWHYVVGS